MTMCVIYLFIIQYWYICFGDYRDTCTLIGRGCIISHSNPPMQGGYSWGAKFKKAALHFVNIRLKVVMQ